MVGDTHLTEVNDRKCLLIAPVDRAYVDHGEAREYSHHSFVRMASNHELQVLVEHQVSQRGDVLKRVAFGIGQQPRFIGVTDAVAEERVTAWSLVVAHLRKRLDERSRLVVDPQGRVVQGSLLTRQKPTLVVSGDALHSA